MSLELLTLTSFLLVSIFTFLRVQRNKMISKSRTVVLFISIVCAYVVWGALISIPPTFYPTEAEKKGADPAQVK